MASFLRKRKKCPRRMFLSHSKGVIRFMCKYIGFKVLIFLYIETLRGKEKGEGKRKEEKLTYLRSQINK